MTDSGGSTSYLFDGSRVLADSRADYTNGGVTGLISERAGSTSKVYHGDQIGSTRGMSNGSEVITDSREYDAWGLTIASSGSGSPFGFVGGQGYQKDPDSGLMLLGARYYDPSVGRFISRDPIGYAGGINQYRYCENNPVGLVDPDGTNPFSIGIRFVSLLDKIYDAVDDGLGFGEILLDVFGGDVFFAEGPYGGGVGDPVAIIEFTLGEGDWNGIGQDPNNIGEHWLADEQGCSTLGSLSERATLIDLIAEKITEIPTHFGFGGDGNMFDVGDFGGGGFDGGGGNGDW